MSAVLVFKNEQGKLEGFGAKGEKTYGKFLKAVRELQVGELLSFSFVVPRSPGFHKRFFKGLIEPVFKAQEQYSDMESFRKWAEVGAGYCDVGPGPNGKMVAIPRSINYETLDQAPFEEVVDKVEAFLRSRRATDFLWPHLSEAQQIEMMDAVLSEFSNVGGQ